MQLRDYQSDILNQLLESSLNDLVHLDTGAGKTPILAAFVRECGKALVVAHRNLLIVQASEKIAAFGIRHDIVGTEHTRRRCARKHIIEHGKSFVERGNTSVIVASIDSLTDERLGAIDMNGRVVLVDEGHHVIPGNKWGRLAELEGVRVVGFTATPSRLDDMPLGRKAGGVFDRLIQAQALAENSTSTLIERGHLSGFRYFSADRQLERGELSENPVSAYNRMCPGTRCVVFAPAIGNAEEFADDFKKAGIAATCVHSGMTPARIARTIDHFVDGRVKVIVNVDMIGEGFDFPAIESLIIATTTASLSRFRQWVGRVLRPSEGKREAIICDLTGCMWRHGLPTDPIKWDIDRPPSRLKDLLSDAPCFKCGLVYPVTTTRCPDCGEKNILFRSESVGVARVDLKLLDIGLVRQAEQRQSAEAIDRQLRESVVWPYRPAPSNSIEKVCDSLIKWFVSSLEGEVSYSELNAFIRSVEAQSTRFWVSNFTAADARSTDNKKVLKVWKAWKSKR